MSECKFISGKNNRNGSMIFSVQLTQNIYDEIISKINSVHLNNRIENVIRAELYRIYVNEVVKEKFNIKPKEAEDSPIKSFFRKMRE